MTNYLWSRYDIQRRYRPGPTAKNGFARSLKLVQSAFGTLSL
jgi:hypothetical protein